MIIENIEQVTDAVVQEMRRTPEPRTKEILESMVRHLHAFVREVGLTEKEFDQAINYIAALGQLTTESHNEVRLMAGSLGLSTLICLMNNRPQRRDGKFRKYAWDHSQVAGSLRTDNGACPHSSEGLRHPDRRYSFKGWVRDHEGNAIAGAEVDVWHASPRSRPL